MTFTCSQRPDVGALLFLTALAAPLISGCVVPVKPNTDEEAMLRPLRGRLAGVVWDQTNGHVFDIVFRTFDDATDDELEVLKRFVHLRNLALSGTRFTDAAMAHLKYLKKLEDLSVCRVGVNESPELTDKGLGTLSELTSLSHLMYHGARVTDAGLAHVGELRALEGLHLTCRQATDRGLQSLAKLDRLTWLGLTNQAAMTGTGLAALPAPEKLENLFMGYINDAGIETIMRFSNLRYLFIGGTDITTDGFRRLRDLKKLEKLAIHSASLDDRALEASVAQLPWLKELRISKCPVTADAIKHLEGLKSLQVLTLSAPGIEDKSIPHLAELRNVRVLSLENTAITEASLPTLLKLRKLEDLTVPFSIELTDKARKQLLDALPNLEHVKAADREFRFPGKKKGEGFVSRIRSFLGLAKSSPEG